MTFAVLAVMGMALIMTPLMLYAFDLDSNGWHWSHAALFVCMIASTDAVAVSAVLKKANGPETLAVLMEGESLFNDATSIVLFEVRGGRDDLPVEPQWACRVPAKLVTAAHDLNGQCPRIHFFSV